MTTYFVPCVQGAAVGALATLLAAKIRRSMAWHRRGSHENTAPDSSTQRPRLWHDCVIALGDIPAGAPVCFSEGGVIRGNGNGGPSTPKPPFRPASGSGYQPRPHGGTPIPPPNAP
jgi:hypothetical protein